MTLEDADHLLAWMREHHVRRLRMGEVEIELADEDEEPAWIPIIDRPPVEQAPRYEDPLDDPALFGGQVPNFRVSGDK